jgi:hypothetical protein
LSGNGHHRVGLITWYSRAPLALARGIGATRSCLPTCACAPLGDACICGVSVACQCGGIRGSHTALQHAARCAAAALPRHHGWPGHPRGAQGTGDVEDMLPACWVRLRLRQRGSAGLSVLRSRAASGRRAAVAAARAGRTAATESLSQAMTSLAAVPCAGTSCSRLLCSAVGARRGVVAWVFARGCRWAVSQALVVLALTQPRGCRPLFSTSITHPLRLQVAPARCSLAASAGRRRSRRCASTLACGASSRTACS